MNAKYPWIFVVLFLFVALLLMTPRPVNAQDDEGGVATQTFTVRNTDVQSADVGDANSSDLCTVTAELRWYKGKKVKVLYHWQHCIDAPTVYWELVSIQNANGNFTLDTKTGLATVYNQRWPGLQSGDRLTLHTWINDAPQADVVTEFQERAPIWAKIHTRQDSGGACFQFTGHIDPWGVFTAGDHSYIFELNTQDWETPWVAGPNQPTVDWHVQFYKDAALTQLRTEYWFNNVANPCYKSDPPQCDEVVLSIPNGTLIPESGAAVDVTIVGQHGSQYRIVDGAGKVVAGPSAQPTLNFHALPNVTYQGQLYSETHGWTTVGCQFQYGEIARPVCNSVALNPSTDTLLPPTGQQVEVTIDSKNGSQYRVVDVTGAVVAGPSATPVIQFKALPNVAYQAQLYSAAYGWTTSGCQFQYGLVDQPVCEGLTLNPPAGSDILFDGQQVDVTVHGKHGSQYRIVDTATGAVVAGPSGSNLFSLLAQPNIVYQAQLYHESYGWTTSGCTFVYRSIAVEEPFCEKVDLSIPNGTPIPQEGADVVVQITDFNASQRRIVDAAGTLVTGPSPERELRFHAMPDILYQVQVVGVTGVWTSEGCQFRYPVERMVAPTCTSVALSVPNGAVIAAGGAKVDVTISGQHATLYQIVDEDGQMMAGPGGDSHMQIHAMPNVRYQAQVANADHGWTKSGCDFTYMVEKVEHQAFCELRASHYGDPGGRSRITAWVHDQTTPVAIERVRINWNQKGEVTYPTKRQAGPWFTNSEFTLLSRPEVFDVGFGYYKYEAWVYVTGITEPAYCWGDGNAPDHDNVLPDPGPFAKPNPEGKLNRGNTPSRLPTVGRLPFDGGNGPDKVELILWAFEKEGRGVDARITAIANEGKPLARLGMSSVSDVAKFDGLNAREGIVYGFQIGEHGPWGPLFCPKPDGDPTTITVYWAAGGLTWLSDGGAYGDCWWLTVAAALNGWVTVDERVATYNALQPIIDWNGHRNLVFSLAQSRETGLGPRMQDMVIGLQAREWQGPVVPTTLPADFSQTVEAYRVAQNK